MKDVQHVVSRHSALLTAHSLTDRSAHAMMGAVEQLVAAQGRTFHGTQRSTFSNLIVRLRGYLNESRGGVDSSNATRWLPCLDQAHTGSYPEL